jgi:hypothetical protein
MSDPDFLSTFRCRIAEIRQATFSFIVARDQQDNILYHTTCSHPSEIDALWDSWRAAWPHLAPPEKPNIRTTRDMHEALDRLQRRLEFCFGFELPNAGTQTEELPQYVTLDQAAALVQRSKRTLEKALKRKKNPLPDPDVQGIGGRPNEWEWVRIKTWLEREYSRKLPIRCPTLRN